MVLVLENVVLFPPLSRSNAKLKRDLQPTPSAYVQTHTLLPIKSKSASHWPHSGPPDWHPPRPSPSPPPQRSPSETTELKKKLYDIFPDQKQRIDRILSDNPYMRDLNALSGLLLGWTHQCWNHTHKQTKQCFMSLWLKTVVNATLIHINIIYGLGDLKTAASGLFDGNLFPSSTLFLKVPPM